MAFWVRFVCITSPLLDHSEWDTNFLLLNWFYTLFVNTMSRPPLNSPHINVDQWISQSSHCEFVFRVDQMTWSPDRRQITHQASSSCSVLYAINEPDSNDSSKYKSSLNQQTLASDLVFPNDQTICSRRLLCNHLDQQNPFDIHSRPPTCWSSMFRISLLYKADQMQSPNPDGERDWTWHWIRLQSVQDKGTSWRERRYPTCAAEIDLWWQANVGRLCYTDMWLTRSQGRWQDGTGLWSRRW